MYDTWKKKRFQLYMTTLLQDPCANEEVKQYRTFEGLIWYIEFFVHDLWFHRHVILMLSFSFATKNLQAVA